MQTGLRKTITMYTQCPECKQQHTVNTEQLRISRGMLKCTECSAMFDALEFINDQPLEESEQAPSPNLFPPQPEQNKKRHAVWFYGLTTGILLFFAQVYYFESDALSQNQTLRPWLLKLCQTLNCQLPEYKNIEEISLLLGSLEPRDDHSYEFKAVISNQARFNQRGPNIKLTLLNFIGEPFAERVFSAHNYRPKSPVLAVDETAEISLNIVAPNTTIGGYTVKLL